MRKIKANIVMAIWILCIAMTCISCGKKNDPEVVRVQKMIDELPGVEEVQELSIEEQADIYNEKLIPAGNAYEALSDEQKKSIDTAPMDVLNGYFNTLVEPLD